jgi:mannosyl-oligosaccharide alpha-1,2-mannosidase
LAKQYLQTFGQEQIYSEMWEEALAGIQKHLVTTTRHSNLQFIAELPKGIGGKLSPKMDHLVCFLPGSIAIAATEGRTEAEARRLPTWNAQKEEQMKIARELTKTCWAMYAVTETGLSPEIAWFEVDDAALQPNPGSRSRKKSIDDLESWKKDFKIKPFDAHNLQRPETVESLFLLFRVTEDPIYREWGWEIFKSFKKHMLVPSGEGYTSLNDVTKIPSPSRDNMESFWLVRRRLFPLCACVDSTDLHSRRPRP